MCVSLALLLGFALCDQVVDCHIAQTLVRNAKDHGSLCKPFPGAMHDRCVAMLRDSVPLINQGMRNGLKKKDILKSMGSCVDIKLKNSVLCDICQDMVIAVEKMIDEGKVEEEILKEVDKLCQLLPVPYASLCAAYVNQGIEQLIQAIQEGLETMDICVMAQLCPEEAHKKKARIPLAKKGKADDMACDMCTKIVLYVEEILKDTREEQEVVKFVQQYCEMLPSPLSALCDQLASDYIPLIMLWLEQGLEVFDICTKVGFCTAASKRPIMKRLSSPLKRNVRIPIAKKGKADDMACDMCTKIVLYVEEILKDTREEQEVVKFVQQYCEMLPSPLSALCDQLASDYIPLIMLWLEQGLEVFDICTKVGFCTASKRPVMKPLPSPLKRNVRIPIAKKGKADDMACDMCTKIVLYVEEILKDTREEQEVVKFVQQYCEMLPSPLSALCDQIASDYIPLIMLWLEQGLEVFDICTKVGFCTAASKAKKEAGKVEGVTCDTCKSFVDFAKSKLTEITVAELWKLVSVDCPQVEYVKYVCELITEENIHQWVDVLVSQVDSQKACELLQLC